MELSTPALSHRSIVETKRLPGELAIRRTVLKAFCDPFPKECLQLQSLSQSQWRHLLRWLDISGLALYFFYRLLESQHGNLLPAPVFDRLKQNLKDNAARTRGMIAESIAIQQEFQAAKLRYAILKGLSFWPNSVPSADLRSQFDLDFLVAKEDLSEAQRILERRGYRLYESRRTGWEYKLNERPGLGLKDLYKHTGSWMVELHIEAGASPRGPLLERVECRDIYGLAMPVLSPVDLLLRQGLHAYKHICSQFARAAFLVEFRRHVLFRSGDYAFWDGVFSAASDNPRASLELGIVTQLISRVMGEFAPESLTSWTVRRLPPSVRLWVELYGHRVVLGSYPGSKLYLLLQTELQIADAPLDRPLWQFLIPLRLPPPVIRPFPNETFSVRLARYRMRVGLLVGRLRFCIVEGLRFVWELHRWRRHFNRIA